MKKDKILPVLTMVIYRLCSKSYADLVYSDVCKLLSVDEIKEAIEDDYFGQITMPPVEALAIFDYYGEEQDESNVIDFDLWYDGKKSDLTLTMTVFKSGDYSIEGIHVL